MNTFVFPVDFVLFSKSSTLSTLNNIMISIQRKVAKKHFGNYIFFCFCQGYSCLTCRLYYFFFIVDLTNI